MSGSKGNFNLSLGGGVRNFPNSTVSLESLFSNSTTIPCKDGSTYTPAPGDERLLRISYYDGSEWQRFAPQTLKAVPYATEARRAEVAAKVGNFAVESLLRISGDTNLAALTATEGAHLVSLAQGSSDIYLRRNAISTSCTNKQTLSYISVSDTWGCSDISFPVTSVAGRTGAISLDYGDISNGSGKYLSYKPNNTACAAGQVLKWNTADSAWKCGDDSTNAGTVTAVTSAHSYLSVVNSGTTPSISANVGTVSGTLAAGNDSRFSDARIPTGSAAGDLDSSYPSPDVVGILGRKISFNGDTLDAEDSLPHGAVLIYDSTEDEWTLKKTGCDTANGWSLRSTKGVPFCMKKLADTAKNFKDNLALCLSNQADLCTLTQIAAACEDDFLQNDVILWTSQFMGTDIDNIPYYTTLLCSASTNTWTPSDRDQDSINTLQRPYCCRPLNR